MIPKQKIAHIYWILLLFLLLTSGCNTNNEKSISIQQFISIENISAGSGICKTEEGLWVIGDDSPYLYLIDDKGETQEKYLLSKIPSSGQENYSKSIKPDFEAMDVFNDTLLIIGSGSQAFTRDTAYVFDSKSRKIILKKSLHNLYHKFYLQGDFPIGNSINLEGLANDGKFFYFFQRGNVCGNNRIYRIAKKVLLNYLFSEKASLPEFNSFLFDLPMINSNQSGFSGACFSKEENTLYVSISVESTDDVYNDGEILGSFIGKIKINNKMNKKFEYWPIKDSSEQFVISKIETIYITEVNSSEIIFFGLSDNDNGKTGFYKLLLH
ncbi:MAG: hypothetical protein DRI74_03990 [Bacteroidetes bacterium]|nr:MAG: hypothetical protein DRI74_03990 [Bacteroidota bacterium]